MPQFAGFVISVHLLTSLKIVQKILVRISIRSRAKSIQVKTWNELFIARRFKKFACKSLKTLAIMICLVLLDIL